MSDGRPTVLVLVPRPEARKALVQALGRHGLSARGAADADELFAALESSHLDAVIVHNDLPGGSGYELVYDLRRHELGAEVRVVLLTEGEWSAAMKAMALQDLAVVDVYAEPLDVKQVAELLRCELLGPSSGVDGVLVDPSSHAEKRHVEVVAAGVSGEAALMRGNLVDTPFPELLHQLYRQGATGALFLLKDSVKKIVYFKEGHPTYVKSNVLAECLGNVLVRERLISQRDRERSLGQMRESGRQQGNELIAMGSLSPQNLVFGLELQLRTKLFDIFRWSVGEFLFKPQAKLPADVIRLDLSNAGLIVEGVRRAWKPERLAVQLSPYVDAYPVLSADPDMRFQQFPVDQNERAFIDAIGGHSTLQEEIERSPLLNERAAALTYALIVCGVLEVHDAPKGEVVSGVSQQGEALTRQQLSQELLSLRQQDAFGVLGVGLDIDDHGVEQAYSRLARHFHPDRFRQQSAETRQMAREIFGLIYSAYSKINSMEKRQVYRRAPTVEASISGLSERMVMAQKCALQARELAREERWSEVRKMLVEAVGLLGDAPDLRAELGWATHMEDPENSALQREAIHQLRKAIDLDPRHERSYLFLGRIYAQLGRHLLAERQFERAVQCNPHCDEALERLAEVRGRQSERRHGGMRKSV
ncbi:MAG: DUF4388 domain-containing protein [Deltaproteobacteria bacterium]|nr:DUF4388 domain-containing protein [Deltaproteobacteria bacterium]